MDAKERQQLMHEILGYACIAFIFMACLITGDDNFGEAAVAAGILWMVTD